MEFKIEKYQEKNLEDVLDFINELQKSGLIKKIDRILLLELFDTIKDKRSVFKRQLYQTIVIALEPVFYPTSPSYR